MKKRKLKRKPPYKNVDPARRQEVADSQLINADFNAIANLSPTPINTTVNLWEFVQKFKPGNDEITGS